MSKPLARRLSMSRDSREPSPSREGPDSSSPPEDKDQHQHHEQHHEEAEDLLSRIISFHPFTQDSYKRLVDRQTSEKLRQKRAASKAQEAHLVDGELIFGAEDEEGRPPPSRNPDLVEGHVLRDEYGVFPPAFFGKPLEEIDKGITDETFVVIAKKFRSKNIFRFSATRAFFLLPPWNVVRRAALFLATHQFFDLFIIITILVNCVFLAMPNLSWAETAEYVFLAIYVLEMLIKMLARGFILNPHTYLRDPWNWLDFIVIVSAFMTIIIQQAGSSTSVGNMQGLRTFRVFRALKTVSIVPGLKTLVNALLRAFKMLFEVIILTCFCLMVFALFALQIYMGTLRQKCVKDIDSSFTANASLSYDQYYALWIRDSANWQVDDEGEYQLCGNDTGTGGCNANYTCLGDVGENPNYGITSFDHFGWAMLNAFQLLTLDFWEDTYNKVIRANGPWNVLFFMIIIFFGAFYLLNLMLAVVAMSYEEEAINTGKEKERDQLAEAKKQSHNPVYDLAALTVMSRHAHEHAKEAVEEKRHQQQQQQQHSSNDHHPQTAAAIIGGSPNARKPPRPPQKITVSPAKEPMSTERALVKAPSLDSGYSSQSQHQQQLQPPTTGRPGEKGQGQGSEAETRRSVVEAEVVSDEGGSVADLGKSGTGSVGTAMSSKPGEEVCPEQRQHGEKKEEEGDKGDNASEKRDCALSASGVILDKDGNSENNDGDLRSRRGRDEEFVIVTAETVDDPEEDLQGKLVDRNCGCCRGCCRCFVPWLRLENAVYRVVSDPLFDLFITFCIVLNTVFMAIEHHGMSSELELALAVGNYVFSGVFILEAVLKILALNKFYFCNGWNVFDLVIVIASIVDLGVENVNGLSVLRTFRLLRVVKLAQSWSTMRILLTIIVSTLGAMSYLTIILFLVIYIFAVMGLQLFREDYENFNFGDTEATRWHFKDFFHAFMMIFRVLCGEWIEPLWQCMRAANELCMAVFLPALIIGNFIVLNLFLALLINAFATDTLDKHKESAKEADKMGQAFQRLKQVLCCCCPFAKKTNAVIPATAAAPGEEAESGEVKGEGEASRDDLHHHHHHDLKGKEGGARSREGTEDTTSTSRRRAAAEEAAVNGQADGGSGAAKSNGMLSTTDAMDAFKTSSKRGQFFDFNKARELGVKDSLPSAKVTSPKEVKVTDDAKVTDADNSPGRRKEKKKEKEAAEGEGEGEEEDDDLELGDTAKDLKKEEEEKKAREPPSCFPAWYKKRVKWIEGFNGSTAGRRWHRLRTAMLSVVDHKVFEWIVLFVIFASSITLAFEDVYLYQKTDLKQALDILNIIFCVLFGIEMLMKWVAYGFTKYFTEFWTILDFLIVVISVASLVGDSLGVSNITAFRSLRTLRALRPLRAISRWEGMRIVVNSLMRAIPSIFNVLLVGMMFWLIFSIMGVQFFSGRFYKCVNATSGDQLPASSFPNKTFCISSGERWRNSYIHFDNSLAGFLALFQVATFEGWMEVMQDAVDVTEVDLQPDFEANKYAYLYFVIFIVFGSFFILNLFISVIIDNFNELKKKYEGSYLDAFLTESQRNYYNMLKKLGNKKPQKTIKQPKNAVLKFFYKISMSTRFELAVVLLIALNMVAMAIEHYNQSQAVTQTLKILNIIFTSVFILEAVVKLLGLRWHYFRVPWNIFDFLIVLLSLVDIVLGDLLNSVVIKPTLLRVVRVFRIGRVLRLIKAAKGIRKLLFALIISLPAIFNIGALLFLIMYIYAIIGMTSFGDVKENGVINDLTNFQTFGSSFLLLIRLATSAGWNDVLEALLIEEPDCNSTHKTLPDGGVEASSFGDCGIPWLAIPFMVSYIIVVFLIVVNMYIAVILENFNQAHQQEEMGITEDDFDMFYVVWERYDPHATQFIKYDQLSNFVADLDEPLKIEKPNEITLVSFNLAIMEGDKLHCLDILMALVRNHLTDVEDSEELDKLKEQMQIKFAAVFPSRKKLAVRSSTMQRKKEDVAARTLQRAWRRHCTKQALKNITQMALRQSSMHRDSPCQDGSGENANGVRGLRHRIGSALTVFFGGGSRSPSVTSRTSSRSANPSPRLDDQGTRMQALSKQSRLSNTLQVPQVDALYGQDHDTEEQSDDVQL
ncbi:sodium channel protein 1 brain-like [Babylonia areolata]|uniref:sodium channel protein 1 brain-like n=1 Tax=Babylonia areolata TaxID=304850 RepID=UPI003FD00761